MDFSSAEYGKHNMTMRINQSWNIAHPVKRTTIYSLIVLLTSLLFSWLLTMNLGITVYAQKFIYLALILIIGIGHIFTFPAYLKPVWSRQKNAGLVYSFLAAIGVGLFNFILFYATKFANPQWAIAGACSFLLPFALVQCWKYFETIDVPAAYEPWYLPEVIPQKKASIFINSLQIKLKIKMNYYDVDERIFNITVPGRLHLGNMFHSFLVDKEEEQVNIQLHDQHQKEFAWNFFLQKSLDNKPLDPYATLIDNNIKQHSIILAERVKLS